MASAKQRKQSKLNGQQSHGPTTEAGKERSRQNAFKHGFTAVELALPIESAETIQAEADAWFDALEPKGTDQINLANQAALAALRLQRLTKAEAAIIAKQVGDAALQWDRAQDHMLNDLKKQLYDDPGTASIELKSFGKGVAWLLGEWLTLHEAFEVNDFWNSQDCIRHALRLQGFNPLELRADTDAQEFVARAVACIPDPDNNRHVMASVARDGMISNRFRASHANWASFDRDESIAFVQSWMVAEIRLLMDLRERLNASETRSRASAGVRAMVPEATHQNQLMLRYSKSAASELDRALKTLVKLKQARREEAEQEAEEVEETALQNEPSEGSEANTNGIKVGSCVKVGGVGFVVYDKSEAMLSLAVEGYTPKKYEIVDTTDVSEVVSTPLNGV